MTRVPAVVIVTIVVALVAEAQKTSTADPFANVPAENREQLRADVQKAIDLQKHGKWKEFDAVYDKDFRVKHKVFTPAELSRMTRLEDFAVEHVAWNEQQQAWMVRGCAIFEHASPIRNVGQVAGFTVRYVNGAAKFLPVLVEFTADRRGIQQCRFERQR